MFRFIIVVLLVGQCWSTGLVTYSFIYGKSWKIPVFYKARHKTPTNNISLCYSIKNNCRLPTSCFDIWFFGLMNNFEGQKIARADFTLSYIPLYAVN